MPLAYNRMGASLREYAKSEVLNAAIGATPPPSAPASPELNAIGATPPPSAPASPARRADEGEMELASSSQFVSSLKTHRLLQTYPGGWDGGDGGVATRGPQSSQSEPSEHAEYSEPSPPSSQSSSVA